jgi:hypothetical protein
VSVDPLFAISEGAAVDQLNLLCGWTSGTVNRSCGGKFSLAEGESDITGLRFTWFFAVTPRGSCATALTEICDGAMLRAGDDVGELWPDATELVSESRRMEMLDWFFFVLSDFRLGEYRRVLKTLSHVDGLTPDSAKSAGISSHLGLALDLLSMLRTWSKMGSRVCRVVVGP